MSRRMDTRRFNSAGKLIGNHNLDPWGWSLKTGKYCKRGLNKALRRMWKLYGREVLLSSDVDDFDFFYFNPDNIEAGIPGPLNEPRLRDNRITTRFSNVDWKNW